MNDPVRELLKGPPLELTLYPPNSRYHDVPTAELTTPDGRVIRYLRRRFLPDPTGLVVILEHRVAGDDRLDNLAARYLGDPLQAWRLADGNATLRLEALVEEVGRPVRITLPEGVQASPNA